MKILYILIAEVMFSLLIACDRTEFAPPRFIREAVDTLSEEMSREELAPLLNEFLWTAYVQPKSLQKAVERTVLESKKDLEIVFAAIALIPYHDPQSLTSVLQRAKDEEISQQARWYLLYSTPLILGIGDQWFTGTGDLDSMCHAYIGKMEEQRDSVLHYGAGTYYAKQVSDIYRKALADPNEEEGEWGLAVWHASAYLLGALDVKSVDLLQVFFDSTFYRGPLFHNVFNALVMASNKQFYPSTIQAQADITPEIMHSTAQGALLWWKSYAESHTGNDWNDAIIEGFRDAGYTVSLEKDDVEGTMQLVAALEHKNQATQYNAAKFLNLIHDKRFDLERIFMTGKYSMSFTHDHGMIKDNQQRLKEYWRGYALK